MKILAINGSPNREGFTASLIDMLLEVCKNAGAQCERVNIVDYVMGDCSGCKKCIKDKQCYQDDDYIHLKAKMLEADGIIVGSPYYAGKPTDELRTLMDRLLVSSAYYGHFANKYIVGVSTSAVHDARKVAKYCARLGHLGVVSGSIVSGVLYESTVTRVDIKDIACDDQIKNKVSKVGSDFIQDIQRKRLPSFYGLKRRLFKKRVSLAIAKACMQREHFANRIVAFLDKIGWKKKQTFEN